MSLPAPIVEGAYYLREDGQVAGPAEHESNGFWRVGPCLFRSSGLSVSIGVHLTRRVWITHTDPAEVVAEIQRRAERAHDHRENYALNEAADLVAEKLVGGG